MSHSSEKAALRRSLLQARRSLPTPVWQSKSLKICEHLAGSSVVQSAHTILAYFSIRQEPDLSPLFQLPYRWGFPRCVGDRLTWHQWTPEEPLVEGAFGIVEPTPDAIALSVEEIDLMLVPAVACDWQGYRLGYGGGFYDRLLSQPDWAAIRTLGIVFEDAFQPSLPIDEWDCPLYGVCTEIGLRLLPLPPDD
jgi:5-formyltetrahydrofolate cyclo-ligase